ncbi:MAG: prepilin peptidase [Candidatus Liptonbacteria bacterium]|nr:prepilin peptidase [Candidatus Liptonbacteria bacterium]
MSYALFLLFVLGVLFGSFLNVLSLRYDENSWLLSRKTLGGRSHCQHCKKTLGWHELIPVLSFIFLRGRCASCKHKLSLEYPAIEILSGLIFFLVPLYFFSYKYTTHIFLWESYWLHAFSVLWVFAMLALLLIAAIDYRKYLIPDELTGLLWFLGLVWVGMLYYSGDFGEIKGSFLGEYASLFGVRNNLFINHMLGSFTGASGVFLVFFLSHGRAIGFGDAKLFGALGLLFGWADVVMVFFLSFVIGSIVSIPLLLKKEKTMKDFLPFAPFISIASFLVFYFGNDIMRLYFSLFSLY